MVSGKSVFLVRSRAVSTGKLSDGTGEVVKKAAHLSKRSCHAATEGRRSICPTGSDSPQSLAAFLPEQHGAAPTSQSSPDLGGQSCHNQCGRHIQNWALTRPWQQHRNRGRWARKRRKAV